MDFPLFYRVTYYPGLYIRTFAHTKGSTTIDVIERGATQITLKIYLQYNIKGSDHIVTWFVDS